MAASTPDEARRKYFTFIAPQYGRLTGNSTRDTFASLLKQQDLGITHTSVIHDNAAGPGTATEAVIRWCEERDVLPTIIVTDYIPEMIQTLEQLKQRHADSQLWQSVQGKVVDSLDLSEFPDDYFTHAINNFSLATFGSKSQQEQALKEAYRTLAPGGLAVFLTWKRFAPAEFMSEAQRHIKGDEWAQAHLVRVNGPEHLEEGHLAKTMVEAGFPVDGMRTTVVSSLLGHGADWDGLFEFLQVSTRIYFLALLVHV
jgi:ubiquinone/menaquinone biosynthesis C-methylase UbiE